MPNVQKPVYHLPGEETLGWGIIGAGLAAAHFAIPAIRNQPPLRVARARYAMTNSRVGGLYSHNERRAKAFADTHHISHTYTNLADLLKRADLHCIYIACHPRHHAAFALAALAAGKHVLCEPPLALSPEEAQQVIETAESRGLTLGVNYALRGDSALLALRELMHSGEIGEILGGRITNTTFLPPSQQTWRLQEHGGGVLFDRSAHSIDTLRFLWHDEIKAIDSVRHLQIFGNHDFNSRDSGSRSISHGVEEDVLSRITLEKTGYIVQSHDSFVIPHQPTMLEVFGIDGILIARHCFDHTRPSELHIRRRDEERRIRLSNTPTYFTAIARFHAAVRDNHPPQASGRDGLAVLKAILAGKDSLRRGHRVELRSQTPFGDSETL